MKYEEMKSEERTEFVEMLWSWLEGYSDEVICKVLEKKDEILNNETAMFMLKELHLRKKEENKNYIREMRRMMDSGTKFSRCDILTHSRAYGNVLADMYIHPDWQRSRKENDAE